MRSLFAIRFTQSIIILIPVILFGWLLWQELVPSGMFVVKHNVHQLSPFIERILPAQRASDPQKDGTGDWVQTITGDPTYFFVHPHRHFDSVDAEVWFKNDQLPILELGVLANPSGPVYHLEPLQNKLIDDSFWSRLEKDGLVLLQRQKKFETIDDFLSHLPPRNEIATYQYALTSPFRDQAYTPSNRLETYPFPIKGSVEFYTYIKNESLSFTFSFSNTVSSQIQSKDWHVRLWNEQGGLIKELLIKKDSAETLIQLNADQLPEGVYKIGIDAPDTVSFSTVQTSQKYMTFLNHLVLSDTIRLPVSVWTDVSRLHLAVASADATQNVMVGDQSVRIQELYADYPVTTSSAKTEILTEKGGLRLDGIGSFALSENQFFRPNPVRLWEDTNLESSQVNYVIGKYTPPEHRGSWSVAHVTFPVFVIAEEKPHTWKFVFSAPGIVDRKTSFDVGSLNLTFHRPMLTLQALLDEMNRRIWKK